MKQSIAIKDQNVYAILKEMAKAMNVEIEHNENEHCFEVPKSKGSGYMKAYEFDNGIGVLVTDILLEEDLILKLDKGVIHPLKMIFNREDSIRHKFSNEGSYRTVSRFESLMVSGSHENQQVFKFKAKNSTCLFNIEINRKDFESKIEALADEMNDDLITIFRDLNGVQDFLFKGNYSLDISNYIEEFINTELEGFMKSVYQEGKVYEIFTHQLALYLDDLNAPDHRQILRKSQVKKIEEAVEFIDANIDTALAVRTVAEEVGINQNTLQTGFKAIYNASVNEYIRNRRLEEAKRLMETTSLNVTEVTYKIGINSRSYFSKLFKEKYKISPKEYINSVKSKRKRTKSA